jgi:hypothetical protein
MPIFPLGEVTNTSISLASSITKKSNTLPFWKEGKQSMILTGAVPVQCNRGRRLEATDGCAGSKLKWIDRNTYLAIRRLLDGEIDFL